MKVSMNATTLVNKEPALPDNNEEVIHMLGLDGFTYNNTGKLMDDIVTKLDLDAFTFTQFGEPVASIGFEGIQGHQQVGSSLGAYQPNETISYVDLSPVSPSLIKTSPHHVSEGSYTNLTPVSPPEIKNSPYQVSESLYGEQSPVSAPEVKNSPYYLSEGSNVNLSSVSSPEIKNSPYHMSEDSLFFNEDSSSQEFPQEVGSFVPTTLVDNRKPAGGKTSRRRREPKVKLYEHEDPMSDPDEEKKRLNAINAKKNREKKKNKLQELEILVKSLTTERDGLQAKNIKIKNKCDAFEKQLKTICQQFNVPVIILPQD